MSVYEANPKDKIFEIIEDLNKRSNRKDVKPNFFSVVVLPPLAFIKYYLFEGGAKKGTKGFVGGILKSLEVFVLYGDAFVKAKK